MRFKNDNSPFRLFAVTGTHTVAFAIDCNENEMENLLGFTVEKEYYKPDGRKVRLTVMGFKVFEDRVPSPTPGSLYSTYDNPIQAFSWEDFTAYPDQDYTYHFTPLYGTPLNIQRGNPFSINVKTEPSWKNDDHSVFFNRGVAASQAYTAKFGNKSPDDVEDDKAYIWLSRGLNEALTTFIKQAQNGDKLNCCFYEFRHEATLNELKKAADRGAMVSIIYDAKENTRLDPKTNQWVDSFPAQANLEAIKQADLDSNPNIRLILRRKNKSYISHNKFMILSKSDGSNQVWTGSTNISKGGIFGQSNVGHVVNDNSLATKFLSYWTALSTDPDIEVIKNLSAQIMGNISIDNIPDGTTCVFSPGEDLDILQFYADLLDSAESCSCITLAFTVHDFFQKALSDHTSKSPLTFLLLEKDDESISNYVYEKSIVKAVGSDFSKNPVYKWTKETNTRKLGLNQHVAYIHTKFLLKDPLSEKPVVVTGSANFSKAATLQNDENMLIIKGNKRVADI